MEVNKKILSQPYFHSRPGEAGRCQTPEVPMSVFRSALILPKPSITYYALEALHRSHRLTDALPVASRLIPGF